MKIILYLIKFHLISVYFFIKLIFKQKNQVFFLSRQFDNLSLNYQMIIDELNKNNIKYKYICEKVNSNINDSIRTHGNYSSTKSFIIKLFNNTRSSIIYYFSLYKQMKLISQSKVIIVDGYNLPVCILKHKKGTKVIQMWHALGAIKKFGYQSIGNKDGVSIEIARILKMHSNYDYVLSGSVGMNKYFSEAFNIKIENVLPIGTPTVDYMKIKNKNIESSIYSMYPKMKEKMNVLYSPTFRNNNSYNLTELVKYFDFNKCNLIITFHPKVKSIINDDRIICINNNDFSTFDILKVCDYVITDYSALMIDAAIAGKKILLYVYDYETYSKDNGLNIDLLREFPNLTKKDAKEIIDIILNNKYDVKELEKFKKKYTPNINESSTQKIIELIKRCLYDK